MWMRVKRPRALSGSVTRRGQKLEPSYSAHARAMMRTTVLVIPILLLFGLLLAAFRLYDGSDSWITTVARAAQTQPFPDAESVSDSAANSTIAVINGGSAGGGGSAQINECLVSPFAPTRNLTAARLLLPSNTSSFARIVAFDQRVVAGGVELTIRLAVGPPRPAGSEPPPDSCNDIVRATLFSAHRVVAPRVIPLPYANRTQTSSFDVILVAVVPCAEHDWNVFASMEWVNWGGVSSAPASSRSASTGTCVCWVRFYSCKRRANR